MQGAGHRVVDAVPSFVTSIIGARTAGARSAVAVAGAGADAHESALKVGRKDAVDRQRRVHAATRLVRYGKV